MLEFCAKMCKQSQTFLCPPSPTYHVEDTGKKKYWNFGNYWSQNGDITENAISTRFRRNRICLNFAPKCANKVRLFCVFPSLTDHVEDTGKKKYWNFGNYWSQNGDITENTISTRFRRNRICLNFVAKMCKQSQTFLCLPSPTNHVEDTGKKKYWNFCNYWSQNGDITENTISTRFRRNRVCLNFAPKCANKVRLFCVSPVQLIMWKTLARKKYWNFRQLLISKWRYHAKCNFNTI